MTWKIVSCMILIGDIILISVQGALPKLTLYSKNAQEPVEVIGSECSYGIVFDEGAKDFSCACMTGLWAFYDDSCNAPNLITGSSEEKCISLNQKLTKVHLLSSPAGSGESAAVFTNEMKSTIQRVDSKGSVRISNVSGAVSIVTTGADSWGLKEDIEGSCLAPGSNASASQHCTYSYTASEAIELKTTCTGTDETSISPTKCNPFIQETMQCQSPTEKSGTQQGRAFLDTIVDMGNSSLANISAYDENANITLNITYPAMNSEIWNYFTIKAHEILNLSTVNTPAPSSSAVFKFLEISKQIIQKTCPDTYVSDGHFDMALSTFVNLQTKEYKFKDPFDDFATAQRIEDSLKVCLDQIELYPFVDAAEFANKNGSCNYTIEMGTFEAFNTWTELNLTSRLASRENEPIIETVWKTFTHAHAACFKYFEPSFNDHHRFTSVVMPVFSNEINDVWKSMNNLTKDTYSGLLGDAIKLMDGVAYCSEYSKLESDYPWDLPRPEKDLSNIRVRRSTLDKPSFKCLKESYENTCK